MVLACGFPTMKPLPVHACMCAQVSQVGQFEAEMSSDSFQLLGMAERGFLPACLARRSRHQTPSVAIVLSSVGICTLTLFDFRQVRRLDAALW